MHIIQAIAAQGRRVPPLYLWILGMVPEYQYWLGLPLFSLAGQIKQCACNLEVSSSCEDLCTLVQVWVRMYFTPDVLNWGGIVRFLPGHLMYFTPDVLEWGLHVS